MRPFWLELLEGLLLVFSIPLMCCIVDGVGRLFRWIGSGFKCEVDDGNRVGNRGNVSVGYVCDTCRSRRVPSGVSCADQYDGCECRFGVRVD